MKLKELEKRLEKEPNNLGLRVTVAGLLHEAGRTGEAVELYRSVAIAYRDGGRRQQALAVCRSVLGIAPDDAGCRVLLAELTAPPAVIAPLPTLTPLPATREELLEPKRRSASDETEPKRRSASDETEPKRRSSMEETPLPRPMPYHVADPSSRHVRFSPTDLPNAEGADTRPGTEPRPDTEGLAQAARRISGWITGDDATDPGGAPVVDLSAELDTRRHVKVDLDDAITPVRDSSELTQPRDKLK